MTQFNDTWIMHKTILGEGAFGEVRLLINRNTNEKVACKIVDLVKHPNAKLSCDKEVMIHKILNHENIIRYFGRRQEPLKEYIYLEYASRGELFQMIEPDVGMPSNLCQTYMRHLLLGLEYLHDNGIAHRDIKPENLLIDDSAKLKICDFGMATMFRYRGKERLLDKKCGTKPYCAPEVFGLEKYKAEPADIWSAGIVFVAMLTGELPWSDTNSEEFEKYKADTYITLSPWTKLGNSTLSLILKILAIDHEKRLNIGKILEHPWMQYTFEESDKVDGAPINPAKRWNSMLETETRVHRSDPVVVLSQPSPAVRPTCIDQLVTDIKLKRDISFSQPTHNEDLIVSPFECKESLITKETFKLFRRMTRFYVVTTFQKTIEALCSVLDTFHYTWHADIVGGVTINTVDSTKHMLVFKAHVIEIQGKVLLDFRLSKGCGLEFKKKFMKLKECLSDIVDESE